MWANITREYWLLVGHGQESRSWRLTVVCGGSTKCSTITHKVKHVMGKDRDRDRDRDGTETGQLKCVRFT
jgi:hypothetical protein